MLAPDKNSNRSKKRAARGITSFIETRKHKRMNTRLIIACTISRSQYKPGEKVMDSAGHPSFTAGGSRQYH